jgi:hypothetical protein
VSRLKRLIQEIHRRSLWQVLGIYLVGAWVAFQGIEALASGLGLSEWVPGFALVVMIMGLPIVLAPGWTNDGGRVTTLSALLRTQLQDLPKRRPSP